MQSLTCWSRVSADREMLVVLNTDDTRSVNRRPLDDVQTRWPGDAARAQRVSLIEGGACRHVRMSPMAFWQRRTRPWPDDFQLVRRVIYLPATDTLYLSGYLQGQKIDSWGVAGHTLRRYDHWVHGPRTAAWTNAALPVNPHSEGPQHDQPLTPEGLAVAGDYIFVGMVKPEDGKQQTHILAAADGTYVGTFEPGPAVGGNAGWQDMPYSVAALQRQNGEYLVLVEEDYRGKNLLYRWTPK